VVLAGAGGVAVRLNAGQHHLDEELQMAASLIRPVSSTVTVTLKGLTSDGGDMPVSDVVSTLSGWKDFLQLSTAVIVNKQLELFDDGSDGMPAVAIRKVGRGSWIVQLILTVMGGILVAEYSKHRRKLIRLLAKWRQQLFKSHLEQKRSMHNIQQAANALKALAEEHGITCPDNIEAVVEALDDSLKRATVAIDHAAESIELDDQTVTTAVSS
jgi:hypothetical protein